MGTKIAATGLLLLLALAGCAGDEPPPLTAPPASGPTPVDAVAPSGASAQQRRDFAAGKRLTESSGCLGCHQIGRSGSGGPGPDLSSVGARLSAAEILAALERPDKAPYVEPARGRLDTLVAFLSGLRRAPRARNPSTGPAPLGAGMLSLCCQ